MSALDLISKYASPGMVINAYSFMSLARISSGLNKDRHYRENMVSWNSAEKSGAMSSDGMYIERQDRLTFLKYGGGRGYPLSYGGCEMIAVYNLLSYLNEGNLPPGCDLPDIIRAFESKGVALEGAFGSSPKGMISFLKKQNCDMTIKKPGKDLDPGSLSGKPFIFTAFNDRNNIHSQLHTMAATPEAGGRIVLHNSFETKTGSSVYEDPADVLMNYRKGMGRTVCVIC